MLKQTLSLSAMRALLVTLAPFLAPFALHAQATTPLGRSTGDPATLQPGRTGIERRASRAPTDSRTIEPGCYLGTRRTLRVHLTPPMSADGVREAMRGVGATDKVRLSVEPSGAVLVLPPEADSSAGHVSAGQANTAHRTILFRSNRQPTLHVQRTTEFSIHAEERQRLPNDSTVTMREWRLARHSAAPCAGAPPAP
jgi:hypothetical protein